MDIKKLDDSVSAAPVFCFGTSGSGKSETVQSAMPSDGQRPLHSFGEPDCAAPD